MKWVAILIAFFLLSGISENQHQHEIERQDEIKRFDENPDTVYCKVCKRVIYRCFTSNDTFFCKKAVPEAERFDVKKLLSCPFDGEALDYGWD